MENCGRSEFLRASVASPCKNFRKLVSINTFPYLWGIEHIQELRDAFFSLYLPRTSGTERESVDDVQERKKKTCSTFPFWNVCSGYIYYFRDVRGSVIIIVFFQCVRCKKFYGLFFFYPLFLYWYILENVINIYVSLILLAFCYRNSFYWLERESSLKEK